METFDFAHHKQVALNQVRAFFDDCVPKHRRHLFTEFAQKKCTTLWAEFEALKKDLENPEPRDIQQWTYTCGRYVVVSKELIRRVSFDLHRAVLP